MTGGCIHETARLSTNLQEDFFLKWAQGPPSDVFAAEADGLNALRNSTDLTVPEVIGYSDAEEKPAWLLLEYVPHGSPGGDYAERLGEALAVLHEAGDGPYGWHRSNYIGSLPQANTSMDDWPAVLVVSTSRAPVGAGKRQPATGWPGPRVGHTRVEAPQTARGSGPERALYPPW